MLIADLVITFEGNYNSYVAQYAAPAWTSSYPASKFWHLVHTTPNTVQALTNAIRLSEQRNAGSIYVTDDVFINPTDDPWNSLPTFFPTELALLKSRCG